MNRSRIRTLPDVRVEGRGEVPGYAAEYARTKVLAALGRAGEPVPDARVRLSQAPDTTVRHPAHAQVNVDVNGRSARARRVGRTCGCAVPTVAVCPSSGSNAAPTSRQRRRGAG